MNSYLECAVLGFFFLIKSENSLMHGLFHDCSFMHKLVIISCTGTCPVCAVNVSSFDDCIPLETLSYEQLNGVSFSGVKYH